MRRSAAAVAVASALLAAAIGGCGGSGRAPSRPQLVRAGDLHGSWRPYPRPADAAAGHFCGRELRLPEPQRTVATAFAVSPDDGPIMGERIEHYRPGEAATVLRKERDLHLPCEWTDDAGRWRMAADADPAAGRDGRVFLVTNLDRVDSFNYEVAMRSGDDLVLVVVNERIPDRALVDQISAAAWRRGTRH